MHKCVCIHSIASFHLFLCSAGQSHLFIHIDETVGNLWLWFYTNLSLFQEWAKHFDYKLWLVNSILASCILTFHTSYSPGDDDVVYVIWLCWHFLPVVFIHNPCTISTVVWVKWTTLHNLYLFLFLFDSSIYLLEFLLNPVVSLFSCLEFTSSWLFGVKFLSSLLRPRQAKLQKTIN